MFFSRFFILIGFLFVNTLLFGSSSEMEERDDIPLLLDHESISIEQSDETVTMEIDKEKVDAFTSALTSRAVLNLETLQEEDAVDSSSNRSCFLNPNSVFKWFVIAILGAFVVEFAEMTGESIARQEHGPAITTGVFTVFFYICLLAVRFDEVFQHHINSIEIEKNLKNDIIKKYANRILKFVLKNGITAEELGNSYRITAPKKLTDAFATDLENPQEN